MTKSRSHRRRETTIKAWELRLIKYVAGRFRTNEREDLEADLAVCLLDLKTKRLPTIRAWDAYLASALYNKAANWIRRQRTREGRHVPICPWDQLEPGEFASPASLPAMDAAYDLQLAFAQAWSELNFRLRPSLVPSGTRERQPIGGRQAPGSSPQHRAPRDPQDPQSSPIPRPS